MASTGATKTARGILTASGPIGWGLLPVAEPLAGAFEKNPNTVGEGAAGTYDSYNSAAEAGEAAFWNVYQQLMKTPGMTSAAAKRQAEKARTKAADAWTAHAQGGQTPAQPGQPAAPGTPGAAGPDPNTPQGMMQLLLDESRRVRQENKATADQHLLPALGELGGMSAYADAMDDRAMGLQDQLAGSTNQAYQQLALDQGNRAYDSNRRTANALGDYLGDTSGLMGQIGTEGFGADVLSDAESMAAQRQSLQGYQDLSNPQVTAQERYLQELARRNQEQQELASRDAVMSDLQARGMAGSGAQLTNMLGTQQQLAQERTLSDLGTQAQAVGRSMEARAGAAGIANSMRNQADQMALYNKTGRVGQQNWQSSFAQSEADRVAALAGERNKTTEGANETQYGRDRDTLAAREGAATAEYKMGQDTQKGWRESGEAAHNRGLADYGALGQYVSQSTGSNAGDFGATAGIGGALAGYQSAEDAAEKLGEDDSQWWNPFSW